MLTEREEILDFIRMRADHPMKTRELARALSIPASGYPQFRRTIRELIESGDLVRLKRNRIGLADEMDIVVGRISVTRNGIGFVACDDLQPDILVPSENMLTAMDGDKVMVRLSGHRSGRTAGKVIRIIERASRNVVGVFHRGRHFSSVVPDDPRIHRHLYIPSKEDMDAQEGEKVVAVLASWEDPYLNPEGRVVDRLGMPGHPGVDMLGIAKRYGLPEQFPDAVQAEANRAAAADIRSEMKRRVDRTKECVYTIDPEDAKDHDDAISVTTTRDGYRLGVHIADVSYFVKAGTALDEEAFLRGNSVYLPAVSYTHLRAHET